MIEDFEELLDNLLQGNSHARSRFAEYRTELDDHQTALLLERLELTMQNHTISLAIIWLKGYLFNFGIGFPRNIKKAIALYDYAIEREYPAAMWNRALIHEQGAEGEAINYPAAIDLYERLISLGLPEALYARALMHQNGRGGEVDYEKAAYLFRCLLSIIPNQENKLRQRTFLQMQALSRQESLSVGTHYHIKCAMPAENTALLHSFTRLFFARGQSSRHIFLVELFKESPLELCQLVMEDSLLSDAEKQTDLIVLSDACLQLGPSYHINDDLLSRTRLFLGQELLLTVYSEEQSSLAIKDRLQAKRHFEAVKKSANPEHNKTVYGQAQFELFLLLNQKNQKFFDEAVNAGNEDAIMLKTFPVRFEKSRTSVFTP